MWRIWASEEIKQYSFSLWPTITTTKGKDEHGATDSNGVQSSGSMNIHIKIYNGNEDAICCMDEPSVIPIIRPHLMQHLK